jgi:hypothetical protein
MYPDLEYTENSPSTGMRPCEAHTSHLLATTLSKVLPELDDELDSYHETD